MESSSIINTCPSFGKHSSNNIADIADRVVHELRSDNSFNDDHLFSFTDGDIPAKIYDEVNQTEKTDLNEDEHEFEFPVICGESDSTDEIELVSDDQISPRYPLFDTSLLSETDLNPRSNAVDSPTTDSKPSPARRSSLMNLFNEDRDSASTSNSSSESDDLDGITPETYCVWKPNTVPPRGKHKKSNSISIGNTSNRWKVRDLLKRSYSDDNYSAGKDSPVLLFIPPISPENKVGKSGKKAVTKTEKKVPAYKTKIGNIRLPSYLPYRQDQVAAYAGFSSPNKHIYRY